MEVIIFQIASADMLDPASRRLTKRAITKMRAASSKVATVLCILTLKIPLILAIRPLKEEL